MRLSHVFRIFRVTGASMRPALDQGDIVISTVLPYLLRNPRVGDIIVALHPLLQKKLIIKRVASVSRSLKGTFSIHVEGDERLSSEDSNSFGSLPRTSILGKVIYVARNNPGKRPHEKV